MDTSPERVTEWLRRASLGDESATEQLFAVVYPTLVAIARKARHQFSGNESMVTGDLVGEAYLRLFRVEIPSSSAEEPNAQLDSGPVSRAEPVSREEPVPRENSGATEPSTKSPVPTGRDLGDRIAPSDSSTPGSSTKAWSNRHHFLSVAAKAMRQILVDHYRKKNRKKRKHTQEWTPLDQLVDTFDERNENLDALDPALEQLARYDATLAHAIELHYFAGQSVPELARHFDMSLRSTERSLKFARAWLRREIERGS